MSVRRSVLDEILAHAAAEAPNECCGLVLGRPGVIDEAVQARNLKKSPFRYLVDPADHFAAIRRARATSRAVMGTYHSHPVSAPVPSPTDLAEANDREFLYLIVTPARPGAPAEIRAYRLVDGNFTEVSLVPTP